jgi:ABC-type glutathione transport system ATPase component
MPEPIVQAATLSKVFRLPRGTGRNRELVAVDDVSFAVRQGGSLGIVGESGSGKTTVARMLVGLEVPTSGRITVAGTERGGRPSGRLRRRLARDIQIVFQDPYSSLDPRQSGAQCLDEVLRVHFDLASATRSAKVLHLGEQVGLGPRELDAMPHRLSGGQRQRLAIARALAVEPEVLVLDEAVSALDVSVQAQILNLLMDIRETTRVTCIFISHDLAVVRQVTDETIVMRRGRVVETGPTASILEAPQDPYTRLLRDSVPGIGWRPRRREQAV